jgi:hypothetical protein
MRSPVCSVDAWRTRAAVAGTLARGSKRGAPHLAVTATKGTLVFSRVRGLLSSPKPVISEVIGQMMLSEGPGGLRAGAVSLTLGQPLAPHCRRLVPVRVPTPIPCGSWHVRIRLTSRPLLRICSGTITWPALAGTR